MSGVYMSISRAIVQECGANAAVVHQQVYWWILHEAEHGVQGGEQRHATGWFTGTSERLALITGLTAEQVRGAMGKLLAAGLMEKRKWRAARHDQTCSYRPIEPRDRPGSGPDGFVESTGSSSGESTGCSSSSENSENDNPPNPPRGAAAADGGRLFEEPKPAPDRRARKAATGRGKVPPIQAARFEIWIQLYPKGSQRGDLQAALRAFAKALDGGASTAELEEQLANYVAARNAYRSHWGSPPPLMRAATFLNGKRAQWERPWEFQDLAYWPPPPGKVWGLAPAGAGAESITERRKRMVAEETAAERAAAAAEAKGETRGVA